MKKHKIKFLFIVGAGRSGTSLLQSMLASHPVICMLPESHFARNYLIKFKCIDKRIEAKLLSDKYIKRLDIGTSLPTLINISPTPLQLYIKFFQVFNQSDDTLIYGDKDPRNIDYLTKIKTIIKESIFIHIIRDPRDVVLSRTKANWSKKLPFFLHAVIYSIHVSRGKKQGKILGKNCYYEIHYEDLISDPETSLKSLCSFLKIEFDTSMLTDFNLAAETLVSRNEIQWKKETMGPLLNKNYGKWQSCLSDFQIKIIESICSESFKDNQYTKHANSDNLTIEQNIRLFVYLAISKILRFTYGIRIILKK